MRFWKGRDNKAPTGNSPLELVTDPPMSRRRVLQVSQAGFGLMVCLVLLAAFLGYSGSDRSKTRHSSWFEKTCFNQSGVRR